MRSSHHRHNEQKKIITFQQSSQYYQFIFFFANYHYSQGHSKYQHSEKIFERADKSAFRMTNMFVFFFELKKIDENSIIPLISY